MKKPKSLVIEKHLVARIWDTEWGFEIFPSMHYHADIPAIVRWLKSANKFLEYRYANPNENKTKYKMKAPK